MNSNNQNSIFQNCPYLGLHDDQRTSLAYPSAWNYCYRAHPPASVSISHQITACLCPEFIHCPVYLTEQEGILPATLHGSSTLPAGHRKSARRKTRRIAWSVFIIILLTMLVIAGQRFFPGYFSLTTAAVRLGLTYPVQVGAVPSLTPNASLPQSLPTATLVPNTGTPTQTNSMINPSATPLPKRCGYTLDTPFGVDVKFTLHQIASGENLDKLAVQHQTTVDAIRSVNYSMPLPVWEDWIVVIPVGILDVKELPSFEPYRADGTIFSLEELALQLNADAQSILKYNAFDASCTLFKGWLIVPRTPKVP